MTLTCGMERCLGCLLPSGDGTTCFLCPHLAQSLSLAHTRAEDITPPPHYNNIAVQYMAAVAASHLTLEEARCERLGKPVGRHG